MGNIENIFDGTSTQVLAAVTGKNFIGHTKNFQY